MPRARPLSDVIAVEQLKAAGYTDRKVTQLTRVPTATIRKWRNRRVLGRPAVLLLDEDACTECGAPAHDFSQLPAQIYAYLLGIYLGDGCLGRNGSSWTLRIWLDVAYPGIIEEVCGAIRALREGKRPFVRRHTQCNCFRIASTWRPWICLFPQHGPGRKHTRRIALTEWQEEIVRSAPGPFLRGLIHTDGWRGINRVRVKGRDYEYPRYQFSNRSEDIRGMFTDACDQLGIRWRPWTRYHVSVAQRESVAMLDSFVGPKH